MKYVKPELEVLKMMTVDIITTSDGGESTEDDTPGVGFGQTEGGQ